MKITYYKLHSLDEDLMEVYIGSTKDIRQRIWNHKYQCKRNWHLPIYMFINVNGGFDNWTFEILDEIEVDSNEERYKIEREFIEKYPLNLNFEIPTRPRNEVYKDKGNNYKRMMKYRIKWNAVRWECKCGSNIRQGDKAIHFKSKKHINYIELNK